MILLLFEFPNAPHQHPTPIAVASLSDQSSSVFLSLSLVNEAGCSVTIHQHFCFSSSLSLASLTVLVVFFCFVVCEVTFHLHSYIRTLIMSHVHSSRAFFLSPPSISRSAFSIISLLPCLQSCFRFPLFHSHSFPLLARLSFASSSSSLSLFFQFFLLFLSPCCFCCWP